MAKQQAIVNVFGDWDKSYKMLPRWLEAMKLYMLEMVVLLQTDDFVEHNRVDHSKQVFFQLFWVFKPCMLRHPFCKPIVQVDGTHLYGKCHKKLLIATTKDRNKNPLPLAFAIVDRETKEA